jgi:hypothetical protein
MRWTTRALSTLATMAALSFAAPAGAAVVFQSSGTTSVLSTPIIWLPDPGNYKVKATASVPITWQVEFSYDYHWDVFLAPPPRPHDEFIEGNSHEIWNVDVDTAKSFLATYVVPETIYEFFNATDYYTAYGIPLGTPLYRETKFENAYLSIFADQIYTGESFDYSITVSRVGAIPEPGTWALLILGFGLSGAVLRANRRQLHGLPGTAE